MQHDVPQSPRNTSVHSSCIERHRTTAVVLDQVRPKQRQKKHTHNTTARRQTTLAPPKTKTKNTHLLVATCLSLTDSSLAQFSLPLCTHVNSHESPPSPSPLSPNALTWWWCPSDQATAATNKHPCTRGLGVTDGKTRGQHMYKNCSRVWCRTQDPPTTCTCVRMRRVK